MTQVSRIIKNARRKSKTNQKSCHPWVQTGKLFKHTLERLENRSVFILSYVGVLEGCEPWVSFQHFRRTGAIFDDFCLKSTPPNPNGWVSRFLSLVSLYYTICTILLHPGKINGWNLKSWRYGSDDFPVCNWVICSLQP